MTVDKYQLWFWSSLSLLFIVILWGLQEVLLPFVLGFAIAYFLDPLVDRIEDIGMKRALSTTIVLFGFTLVFFLGLLFLLPILKAQFSQFISGIPGYIEQIKNDVLPWVEKSYAQFLPAESVDMEALQSKYGSKVMSWTSDVLLKIWAGGLALFDALSILIITPVVSFYLLRDWDLIVGKVDHWLPRKHRVTIHDLMGQIDMTLAGFVRGQASVCIILGVFYSVLLTFAGLEYGVFIGLLSGVISFIPYVGSTVGLLLGVVAAYLQFGTGAEILIVAAIFAVGQFFEGNILTPKLVGEKIGLHAVWVLFALMAGGSLLGFVGIMVAVPVAAVIGVMVRFLLKLYLTSGYYHGTKIEKPKVKKKRAAVAAEKTVKAKAKSKVENKTASKPKTA